jgi:hypothetical protein
MDQLKGSLRFIPLPAVTQFIAGVGSTGRLKITQGAWSGEIALRNGQIVGAQLGAEHGRAALEGMVLALTEAEFAFLDGVVESTEPLLSRDELAGYMAGLVAERERLQLAPGALTSLPCLVDQGQNGGEASQVTIQAAALQLIPSLVYGHTLEQIALRRGLARTLRELAMLRAGGLVRLESAPPAPAASAAAAPATISAPASAPRPVRPLRPVAAAAGPAGPAAAPAPAAPRRAGWYQAVNSSAAAAPATVELPRPRLLIEEARARLEPVRDEPEATPPVAVATPVTPRRSWRDALVGIFIAQAAPQV